MDSPDYIPELAAIQCGMALAETPTKRLAAITLGVGKLIGKIREGRVDKAPVVDGILNSAVSTGLVEQVGVEKVEQTIADALEPLAARVNGGGGWDPTPALWEDNAVAAATIAGEDASPETDKHAGVSPDDFHAYMPMHSYIFAPSRDMWPAASINQRIAPIVGADGKPIPPSAWLDRHKPIEQMTWCPGMPMLIRNRLISEGGWIERDGVACFNLYRPPSIKAGNAAEAGPWVEHVHRIYPDDAEHIVKWLAQRVQRPEVKINHAVVLGGNQGIGKDTLLEPVKHAVEPWNFTEVTPQHLLGRFNGFIKSVIMRINEARDLGEINRFGFYDHMKAYTAAPPDVLRCDEKNLREYSVLNVCGVIVTTNHKADGIFLPADDRRHYVAWSDLKKDELRYLWEHSVGVVFRRRDRTRGGLSRLA